MLVRRAEEPYPNVEHCIRPWENPAIPTLDGGIEHKYQVVKIFCQAFITHVLPHGKTSAFGPQQQAGARNGHWMSTGRK